MENTKLYLYNTLTRKKEEFIPNNKNNVSIYSCGPTVYSYAHIGNLRAFIFSDLLKRTIEYFGYTLTSVTNITDVDDKTIRRSIEECKTLKDFTNEYTEIFFKDLKTLFIKSSSYYPRATDYIKQMIEVISLLIEKKHAYTLDGSVYFDVSSFKNYGHLSKLDIETIDREKGHRIDVDEYDKEDINDFVLWKAYTPKDGDVFWESPFGKGRPGWHLECSTMAMNLLGESIDIHTGGIDLCFPHHENEIAQSESITKKTFSNYWIHCNHLIVNGEKMSKSLNNVYNLNDLLEKGFSPKAIRYVLLSTHYRKTLNFVFSDIEAAEKPIKKVNNFIQQLQAQKNNISKSDQLSNFYKRTLHKYLTKFDNSLSDDLNISSALASIFELITYSNRKIEELTYKDIEEILSFFQKANSILMIFDIDEMPISSLPKDIEKILEKRKLAREKKDFTLSDEYRDALKEKGYLVKDSPKGQLIEPL